MKHWLATALGIYLGAVGCGVGLSSAEASANDQNQGFKVTWLPSRDRFRIAFCGHAPIFGHAAMSGVGGPQGYSGKDLATLGEIFPCEKDSG